MKQVLQNLKTGRVYLEDVPMPQVGRGQVLIQTRRSLVSLGTERMLVGFGRATWLTKARQQPEKVRQVWEKIQSDGWRPTVEAVTRKLDRPMPLGYCNVGHVLAVGEGVTDVHIGNRVASNGPHAEMVCVPRNLLTPLPDDVSDDEAAFVVVGAIGLQGVRLMQPTLGETVVVIGLGLVGLLTVQLLRVNGCRVVGIDIDRQKCRIAEELGITAIHSVEQHPVEAMLSLTNGLGADGVLITASAKNDSILSQAARMSRQRGRIVLVGTADLTLNRSEFYAKELTFQVSCAYGPGRYDANYEQHGHDYPPSYVRWTENRNFQAVVHLLQTGQLNIKPLITDQIHFADFGQIYDDLTARHRIASLLVYPQELVEKSVIIVHETAHTPGNGNAGLIGAGNFVESVLLPALKEIGALPQTIASKTGLNAAILARKYAIAQVSTDYQQLLTDPKIDLCLIATRHDSHAQLTIDALRAGKHVFVEKPLATCASELAALIQAQQQSNRWVLVGFNRRCSRYVQKIKQLLDNRTAPINVVYTINAGFVPPDSWVHNPATGGRLLGEACHFVDLISFLVGQPVVRVCANVTGSQPTGINDSTSLLLYYPDGSTGVVNYFSNGSKAYAKERLEVYSSQRTLVLDNFRTLTGYGFRHFSRLSGRQDKGHVEQFRRVFQRLRQPAQPNDPLPTFAESINATQTMLAALVSLQASRWVTVQDARVAQAMGLTAEA